MPHPLSSPTFAESSDAGRLVTAATITVAASFFAVLGLLGAERLSIARVTPSKLYTQDLFAYTPLRAPERPEPPKVEAERRDASAAASGPSERRSTPRRPSPEPTHAQAPAKLRASPRPGSNPFAHPGLPGLSGSGPSGPACTGPGCPTRSTHLPSTQPRQPAKAPVKVAQRQLACVSCPDPAASTLRAAAAPTFRGGRNVTGFCVDTRGRVERAWTLRSAGDAAVDRACRQRVRGWRLHPYRVDGHPRRACTQVDFEIAMP